VRGERGAGSGEREAKSGKGEEGIPHHSVGFPGGSGSVIFVFPI